MMASTSPHLLFFFYFLTLSSSLLFSGAAAREASSINGVDIQNAVLDVTPSPLYGRLSDGSLNAILCERVKVSGHSRLQLGSYANSLRVILAPSVVIPERMHSKIQVCFHRNASTELCGCGKDEWKVIQKGLWSFIMSPYEERYVDVKFNGDVSGSVTVSVSEDPQQWRLLCLALGLLILLLAPIVSSWVPFYYSSSMVIGVFLVIIILLFQGMKLMPTGRKNFFYLSIYGSVLGIGTFILHHISMLVNSILANFGLSDEMHNPVYIFVIVGIVLAGAALGYWIVRRFVISKDGSVDVGIAQFVKWAMRIIATTFIFQSTLDTPLAAATLVSSYAICFIISKVASCCTRDHSNSRASPCPLRRGQVAAKNNRAEFLSRSERKSPVGKMWNSPKIPSAWSNSPVKGLVSPTSHSSTMDRRNFYSTFHKTSKRKKFSQREWENFTKESTQQAMAEWAASPEVTNWLIENAERIQLLPSDSSSEDSVGSESDSTDENVIGSSRGFNLFNW